MRRAAALAAAAAAAAAASVACADGTARVRRGRFTRHDVLIDTGIR